MLHGKMDPPKVLNKRSAPAGQPYVKRARHGQWGLWRGSQGGSTPENQSVPLPLGEAQGEQQDNCLHLTRSTPIHDRPLGNIGIEGHSLRVANSTRQSLLGASRSLWDRGLCPEVRNRSRGSALPALVVPGAPAGVAQEGEEMKAHRKGEMEVWSLLQRDDRMVCEENLPSSIKNSRSGEFSSAVGRELHVQG